MSDSAFVLGIDIGTSSVKCVIVNSYSEILTSATFSTKADISNLEHSDYNEQNVDKILEGIENCISLCRRSSEDSSCFTKVNKIAICGQMHGCLLWKNSDQCRLLERCDSPRSNLYTWLDRRCSMEFLSSLPLSEPAAVPLSTGFGVATLLWLKQHHPNTLQLYECSGTIADYLVARLCGLDKSVMSTHNAASWGYFNSSTHEWDTDIFCELDFPTHLLPAVMEPGCVAGLLTDTWQQIPKHTEVYVAMGDLQCSVMSCQPGLNDYVLNLSTSAQLSMVSTEATARKQNIKGSSNACGDPRLPQPVVTLPYFGDKVLRSGASLNGGAVLDTFVRMLTRWTRHFAPSVTDVEVYEKLFDAASCQHASSTQAAGTTSGMRIDPCLFGERHDPSKLASAHQIGPRDLLDFGNVAALLCRDLLRNLRAMFAGDVDFVVARRLWACGGAFARNAMLRDALAGVFADAAISFERNADAAYGAALAVTTGDDLRQ